MVSTPKCVRAEVEIDAPIERVWKILTDTDGYDAWNPFTPQVETTLRIGDPVHLRVRLVGTRLMRRTEFVTRNEPHTLGSNRCVRWERDEFAPKSGFFWITWSVLSE